MLNLNYNLTQIKININSTLKEISTGQKELTSQELNKSLYLKTDINNLEFINEKINEFKLKTEQADIAITGIKNNLSNIKTILIKVNDSSNENNKDSLKQEIESNLDEIKNLLDTEVNGEKIFNNKNQKTLIAPGKYKEFNISLNDILQGNNTDLIGTIENIINNINDKTITTESLNKIENIYDNINVNHAKIGIFNNSLNEIESLNNKKIVDLKINKSNIEDANYEESIIKLNELNLQYNAYAMTIAKIQELSLVNFIK